MAQFFADTFEGADGTNLETYDTSWRKNTGASGANITFGGRARHSTTSTAASYYYIGAPAPSPDYTVRGKFYFGAQSGSTASAGIAGRMGTGSQNMYTARFLAGTGLLLLKAINGTYTTLATYPYTLVADTEVVVDLKMIGTQLSVYLDGVLVIGPYTDASITSAGYPGLRTINASTQIQISEMSADDGVAAGGATYTLAAETGGFGLSGSAVSITATRRLAGGNGSFSLTGTPATLRAGRRIVGATGVITLAGAAVQVSASRKLAASPGAFGLAGSNASLKVARRLAASAGAFTLAAGAAQLVYSPIAEGVTLVTSPGQFVMSGSAAGMRVTRRLQAQPGSYALAGAPVSIFIAGGKIDISKISPARIVLFGSSGSRVTPFEGSGSRVTPFESSGSRVTPFEGSGSKTVRFE